MTNIPKILTVIMALMLLAAPLCFAQDNLLKQANIDYSADEVITTQDMTMTSKVYYSPGKMRKDQNIEGMHQIIIIRQDMDVIWMLMPVEKMYMVMSMDAQTGMGGEFADDMAENAVVHEVLGEETIAGIKATKSKVTVKDESGEDFEGLMWQAKSGVVVKMETDRMTMELKNVKLEKQDPQLFEIPDGYTKMSIPGMGGLLEGFMK